MLQEAVDLYNRLNPEGQRLFLRMIAMIADGTEKERQAVLSCQTPEQLLSLLR